jgi:hypothetical protein
VPQFFTKTEYELVASAADALMPPDPESQPGGHPGARALGVAEYIDTLLAAFSYDPPRIFAGGPFSGRAGGEASFSNFLPLSPQQELAWRTRIEGSAGHREREFNGPVRGWQTVYREGLAALPADFASRAPAERDAALLARPELREALHEHTCEGAYGAPEYGGNRDLAGWHAIAYPGDSQPRGYTDLEVSGRD